MPTVLLLTGTCGVGKSTIAAAWANARGGAHISGDEIRNWIRDGKARRANDYQQEAVAQIVAIAAEAFLGLGLDVALDFVWTPPTLRYLTCRLKPIANVHMVWLRCDAKENRRRDAGRPASVVMGDRVDTLRKELLAFDDWPEELRRIDSSGLSVDDVLVQINA